MTTTATIERFVIMCDGAYPTTDENGKTVIFDSQDAAAIEMAHIVKDQADEKPDHIIMYTIGVYKGFIEKAGTGVFLVSLKADPEEAGEMVGYIDLSSADYQGRIMEIADMVTKSPHITSANMFCSFHTFEYGQLTDDNADALANDPYIEVEPNIDLVYKLDQDSEERIATQSFSVYQDSLSIICYGKHSNIRYETVEGPQFRDFMTVPVEDQIEAIKAMINHSDSFKPELNAIHRTLVESAKKSSKEVWACSVCEGTDVEEKSWVHLNTGAVNTDDGQLYHCNSCETEVKRVYVKYKG